MVDAEQGVEDSGLDAVEKSRQFAWVQRIALAIEQIGLALLAPLKHQFAPIGAV